MAGMTDKYPNLPGHLTEFKDGGLQLTQEVNPPKTESVLLLGTAIDGPVMEPVKVDASTFEAVFGKITDEKGIPNGATLGQAFEEAYNAGCRDIRLMRISGSTASAIVKCAQDTKTVEKIYEAFLGIAAGNTKEKSTITLQQMAQEVSEVKVNGVTLLKADYEVTQEAVEDTYIDPENGMPIVSAELDTINYIVLEDEKVLVTTATESISQHIETSEFKLSSEVALIEDEEEKAKYLEVIAVGDYVKVAVFGEEEVPDYSKLILDSQPAAEEILAGKGKNGIVFEPYAKTSIAVSDNVCDSGAFIDVKYVSSTGLTISENSSTAGAYIAYGDVVEFNLPEGVIPYANMTKLYIDGVEYVEADTTVEDASVKVFTVTEKMIEDGENTYNGAVITINPGSHAKRGAKFEVRLPYLKKETYVAELKLETAFGGSLYNATQFIVETKVHSASMQEKILKITKPRSKRSQVNEEPLTYSSFDYPTLGLMARAINNDTANGGFVKAHVSTSNSGSATSGLESSAIPTVFTGGDDGLNLSNQEMFTKLSGSRDAEGYLLEQGAYQLLENYTVDYVVPVGVFADTELAGRFDDFAYELALFCAVVSHRNHTTIGAIATTSPEEPTLRAIEEHVEKLESYDNNYLMRDSSGEIIKDNEGNTIDLGKHIIILAGGDTTLVNQRLGTYAANSAASLAGYVSTLPTNTAPTNKVVKFAGGLKIKYSNAQLDRLTAKRYITYKYKGDSDVAIVDAMTAAQPGSDYERLSTFRAIKTMANETREVADPFLGEPNTVNQRNALSALLDKRYEKLKEAGVIRDYSFNIICTAYDELVGAAKIELTIVPAQELRKITTVIALKPSM